MIVAGFGFRHAASVQSLRDAYALARGGRAVDALATIEDKAATPVFADFATAETLPALAIPAHAIMKQDTQTRSTASHTARGTGSVAEAAALAAAGQGARLLGPRVISQDRLATCALAIGGTP